MRPSKMLVSLFAREGARIHVSIDPRSLGEMGSATPKEGFAFRPPARQKHAMPERPGDPPPRARMLTDRERAEAARLREIA